MSDRFSQILSAAARCHELAGVLSDNGQPWYEALLSIFDNTSMKWYSPTGSEAYDQATDLNGKLNTAIQESKDAAEELCNWWEVEVDEYNRQQYEDALDHFQQRLNAHLAWWEQGTGGLMGAVGMDNPTSAAGYVKPASSVRALVGRPLPPSYTVPGPVFRHYVIEDSDSGDWPTVYGTYKDHP